MVMLLLGVMTHTPPHQPPGSARGRRVSPALGFNLQVTLPAGDQHDLQLTCVFSWNRHKYAVSPLQTVRHYQHLCSHISSLVKCTEKMHFYFSIISLISWSYHQPLLPCFQALSPAWGRVYLEVPRGTTWTGGIPGQGVPDLVPLLRQVCTKCGWLASCVGSHWLLCFTW